MDLAYTVLGDAGADPVVLLPGLTASRTIWNTITGDLSHRYRVYAVDLRGHGDSGHTHPSGYVLDEYVADPPLFPGGGDRPAFTPQFEDLRGLLRDLRARAAGLPEYESIFGSLPVPATSRTAAEALGSVAHRRLALAQASLDPEVLTPAIDGTLFTGADPDVALERPLMVLRADPESGTAAFTDGDVARLRRANPATVIEMLRGSGHAALTEAAGQVTEHVTRFLKTAR